MGPLLECLLEGTEFLKPDGIGDFSYGIIHALHHCHGFCNSEMLQPGTEIHAYLLAKEEAEDIKSKIEAAGGVVEIK